VTLKQKTVEPPEVALDFLGPLDFFNAVYGGGLALIKDFRDFQSAQLFELGHEVVAKRREMGRRPRGHAAGNSSAIDNNHRKIP
jgi:hypothetical protein